MTWRTAVPPAAAGHRDDLGAFLPNSKHYHTTHNSSARIAKVVRAVLLSV